MGATEPVDPRVLAKEYQRQFEHFRRWRLPKYEGRTPPANSPDAEQVGNMRYWYDERAPKPAAPLPEVVAARNTFIERLNALGRASPGDNWISAQRVRYLHEAGRYEEALQVAKECTSVGWWCDAITGFSLHVLGRYAEAETTFETMLLQMSPKERCDWQNLTPYLDDPTRRDYLRLECGTAEREAFENRIWWFSRTRYGMAGNDSRSEHFARRTYQEFMNDAPSAFRMPFPDAEMEMIQRFGWPVGWARGPDLSYVAGSVEERLNVVSSEATPAYRFIPPYNVITNPANSDSTYWALQRPPVVARYQPPYAKKLVMLEHQQALFRRGDTALVVIAYDVRDVPKMGGRLDAALVVTPGTAPAATAATVEHAPAKGTMTVRAPWGPLLMSAEIAADSASVLARARYGIRPPFSLGARVVLSDLLFFEPYGSFPGSVEEVLPHAYSTQKVPQGAKLGVYWEAYNTNPAGEAMTIALIVRPDMEERRGLMGRAARAMRLSRDARPVSITVTDMSARNSSVSPRALELDIATLVPGDYIVELEVSIAGQYSIRTDRRIVVTER